MIQRFFRRFLDKQKLEEDLAGALKTRLSSVLTTFGGAVLDVDNEEHFQLIRQRFHDWQVHQEDLAKKKAP
jgi:hypothetical protein